MQHDSKATHKRLSRYDAMWLITADPNVSAPEKIIYVVLLLRFRNDETGQCNPSIGLIGKTVGRSPRSVSDALIKLVASGWLVIAGTKGGSQDNTNQFNFPILTDGVRGGVTGAAHEGGTPAAFHGGAPAANSCGPPSSTADELSIELSKKDARARARSNLNGNGSESAERSVEGNTQRCLVYPGTPAFDAWHAYFGDLNAHKMQKHLRECMASGQPALMLAPMPPTSQLGARRAERTPP